MRFTSGARIRRKGTESAVCFLKESLGDRNVNKLAKARSSFVEASARFPLHGQRLFKDKVSARYGLALVPGSDPCQQARPGHLVVAAEDSL